NRALPGCRRRNDRHDRWPKKGYSFGAAEQCVPIGYPNRGGPYNVSCRRPGNRSIWRRASRSFSAQARIPTEHPGHRRGRGDVPWWLCSTVRLVATAAGVTADAIANELVVGAEDPLRSGAPEIAVTGNPFGLTEAVVQIHPFAAQAPAAFSRFCNRLF